MTEYHKLVIAVFLLSAAITYAWWVRVRVVCLREELFEIRHSLWKVARDLDAFDDPAYIDFRRRLNCKISAVGTLCLPSILMLMRTHVKAESPPKALSHAMQAAIDEAGRKTVSRLAKYIIRETLTGWIIPVVLFLRREQRIPAAPAKTTIGTRAYRVSTEAAFRCFVESNFAENEAEMAGV